VSPRLSGREFVADSHGFPFRALRSCSNGRSALCRSMSTPTPPTNPMTCSEYIFVLSLVHSALRPLWVTRFPQHTQCTSLLSLLPSIPRYLGVGLSTATWPYLTAGIWYPPSISILHQTCRMAP
jgi:hypothetical protein